MTPGSDGASIEALLEGGPLDTPALHALADQLVTRHATAPIANPAHTARFRAILAAQPSELQRHASKLDARAALGRFRILDGEPRDILHDLALPLMQLWRAGRATEASLLANRYVDIAPQGATGWSLLPLYLSLRAAEAGHTALAAGVLNPVAPRLIAIGGLSGTGKTTLAGLLAARFGRVPGARILRSDVFRKRIAGLPPETRLPPAHYTAQSDADTYEAMFESADDHLGCGTAVILDAVFMRRAEREVAEMLGLRNRAPFTGIWLEAPERDRIARVEARIGDASDAGPEVVLDQSRRPVGDIGWWHRMRANRPLEMILPAARAVLDRPPR